MSFVDGDSFSLAGLDQPDFLHSDHSFPSVPSLTPHRHSSCTTPTCMGDSCRRSPNGTRSIHIATTEDLPSFASRHKSDIFKPLPPVPKISSFHFSVIWNLCSDSSSVVDISPPILARKSTRNSSIGATDGNHVGPGAGVTEIPESPEAFYFSTDPYSPWPSPVRRHFMSRSDGSFSHVSRYSRPESRSGARAPDPPSRPTSLATTGCNFQVVRRVRRLTRNFRLFTRRIHALKTVLRKIRRWEPVIPRSPTPQLSRRRSTRASRPSSISTFVQSRTIRTSISSVLSNSLQRWLEARNQLAYEKPSDHISITISQYEQRGSWLTDDWGDIQYRNVHSTSPQPPRKSIADRSATSIHTEVLTGRYVSVSLRAGEEASRRRKRSSDRSIAWANSETDTDSLDYR